MLVSSWVTLQALLFLEEVDRNSLRADVVTHNAAMSTSDPDWWKTGRASMLFARRDPRFGQRCCGKDKLKRECCSTTDDTQKLMVSKSG